MTWLVLVLALLAGARTWALLTQDDITIRARDWLHNRQGFWTEEGAPSWWQEGFNCPFCFGFWITAGWIATGYFWGSSWFWLIPAGAFAANYIQAHLNARLDRS